MMIKINDIYEAFRVSYRLLIKRLIFFIQLALVFIAISQIANLIAIRLEYSDTASPIFTHEEFPMFPSESLPMFTPKSLVIRLIGTAISLALMIGIIKISLESLRGKEVKLPMLFDSSGKFLNVLAGGILATCIAFAPPLLFTIFMRVLPITPALASIIMIVVLIAIIIRTERLRFFIYFIVDKNSNPFEAIRESRRITNGNIKMLILFDIFCALLNMLGFKAFFVGLLITFPLTAIAKAHLYKKLSATVEEADNS